MMFGAYKRVRILFGNLAWFVYRRSPLILLIFFGYLFNKKQWEKKM